MGFKHTGHSCKDQQGGHSLTKKLGKKGGACVNTTYCTIFLQQQGHTFPVVCGHCESIRMSITEFLLLTILLKA